MANSTNDTSSMRTLSKLSGGSVGNKVQLVELNGIKYVKKTSTLEAIYAEKYFIDVLRKKLIPTVRYKEEFSLEPNQILLEYLEGSPTINKSLTLDNVKKWGEYVQKIHSINNEKIIKIHEQNNTITLDWKNFLDLYISDGAEYQSMFANNLLKSHIDEVMHRLQRLYNYSPSKYSLIHGDLHSENVYVLNNQIYLLDKEPPYLYLPPLFDLAIIYLEVFPAGSIINIDQEHKDEPNYLKAFFNGYGELSRYDKSFLNEFLLLRCLCRYPNPYFRRMRKVVEAILL